jgi:transcription antitermination factor NusA-like protein
MKYFFILSLLCLCGLTAKAQTLPPDSVFRIIDSKFSRSEAEKIKKEYEAADETTREIMLGVFSMPMSSKKELIENYEQQKENIEGLKEMYAKLVPKGFNVFIELKPSDAIPGQIESIDFQIFAKNEQGELDMIDGDWGLRYGSEELDKILSVIKWDRMILLMVKNLLQAAHCISIQNGEEATEIGFARSGLGKYFYLLFPKRLTKSQKDRYNDGCEHIYYKGNVVLKYVGGMAGPQCFTD